MYSISIRAGADDALIRPSGTLDAAAARALEQAITQAASQHSRPVLIDLGQVEGMVADTLQVLIRSARRLPGRFRIQALSPAARAQLELGGLGALLGVRPGAAPGVSP